MLVLIIYQSKTGTVMVYQSKMVYLRHVHLVCFTIQGWNILIIYILEQVPRLHFSVVIIEILKKTLSRKSLVHSCISAEITLVLSRFYLISILCGARMELKFLEVGSMIGSMIRSWCRRRGNIGLNSMRDLKRVRIFSILGAFQTARIIYKVRV